jgi:hypothetical protein
MESVSTYIKRATLSLTLILVVFLAIHPANGDDHVWDHVKLALVLASETTEDPF